MDNKMAIANLFAWLSSKPSKTDWSDAERTRYLCLVAQWDSGLIRKVLAHFSTSADPFRPDTTEIARVAGRIKYPCPDAQAILCEIRRLQRTVGLMGGVHPERPNLRVEGTPSFSHSTVHQVVRRLGGWAYLNKTNIEDSRVREVASGVISDYAKVATERMLTAASIPSPVVVASIEGDKALAITS